MFRFLLGVDEAHKEWGVHIKNSLCNALTDCMVAGGRKGKRYQIAIAGEPQNKADTIKTINDCVVDRLCYHAKLGYVYRKLKVPLDDFRKNILAHALTGFDSESDKKILSKSYVFNSGTALDGVYRFKMQKLKKRWDEIISLTVENGMYIAQDGTYFELIRFLFSNIEARVKDVSIKGGDEYRIFGENRLLFASKDVKEIVYALIDYAPVTVAINKSFGNDDTVNLITKIFGSGDT